MPAFLEHVDHHLGRLIDALKDLEVLDDTLIYLIIGDNGASAEGTPNGCFNEMATLNGLAGIETPEFLASKIDLFGGPDAYNHYAVGWAHAMDTPYQWTKQVASHWGGTRNGTIVHWPNGIKAKGEVRSQFHHVIDVAPTILEAAGLPHPTVVNSVQQAPIEGFSMLYAFNDAKAAERHETQYFEMFCNRGIYHKGWTAVTRHGVPWLGAYKRAFDDDVWELYDTNTDWTQSKDLAKENPKKLAELQRLFIIEATKYSALPLDDRTFERFNPDLAGRPQLIKGKTQILFGGMGRLSENSIVSIKNKSYAITADLDVPKSGAEGVIIAQGGNINGWSLYAKGGKLKYCYNFFGIDVTFVEATQPIPAGQSPGPHGVQVRRRRSRQGRRRHALRRRQGGRPGPHREDRADGVLRRRDLRRRQGSRFAGVAGLRADWQRVQRRGELGADRPREGRSRSHGLAGRALPRRDGAAVTHIEAGVCGGAGLDLIGTSHLRRRHADGSAMMQNEMASDEALRVTII